MDRAKPLEAILWSVAFPGFGQLLNRKIVKGILFMLAEFTVNVLGHFNTAIRLSFLGEIEQAIRVVNYQWLMFYPCVYMFSMYDAYRDAAQTKAPYAFFPFVFGAYFITVGLMYSSRLKLFGVLLGPVWLPMPSLLPGLLIGYLLRKLFLRITSA
ncbi:hypothetical protein [Ectobacillus ponti]|uniref:Uncharacterized protein n=1 Tax=Ectobacillus ponti TaxID=2961894 RepID=A0AA41X262_9BACI|nr:hypothetical protein [Ectobacillus ponti]MCP8967559.1 hypothetical protein [Ectobacillus ponti]